MRWLAERVKSPPFSDAARQECGVLLGRLQRGYILSLPHSRPLPSVGARCHELRVIDANVTWRVVYRIDPEAILIVQVFAKKTQTLPKHVIETCRERLAAYDANRRSER